MGTIKIQGSISNGEIVRSGQINGDQEPELGSRYRVAVRLPWLQVVAPMGSISS